MESIEIPFESIKVQEGLYAYLRTYTIRGLERNRYLLYAAEGYCFYDKTNNLDEDGNLLPEDKRMYARFCSTAISTLEEINKRYVSVSIKEGYEIVN